MAHLYISAAHKSSGKTTLSIGLCAALHRRGLAVQPFKKGPDYIDPLWLGQAAGRACYNLDFYTMQDDEIRMRAASAMRGADIGLIEGNKGLYDGMAVDGSDSNAAMARFLDAPVVLVLDTQGITRGIAPLILGYRAFDPAVRIAGLVLNKVAGARHEAKLRAVIEHYCDIPVIGSVRRNPDLVIDERHLGLVPSNELIASMQQIDRMADVVAEQVNLDAIIAIAATAGDLSSPAPPTLARAHDVRIAVARDAAFGFYYADDLQALEGAGATLIPFSPLHDTGLPDCDGLFLGGGFPETHMEQLAQNAPMCAAVAGFINAGGPAYAECGGLMYLSRSLTWGEKRANMAGVIAADVVMHERPLGRGYVRLRETSDHPWPDGRAGREILAHEFHYSGLEALPADTRFAYEVERGYGVDGRHDGIRYRNLLANYAHLRDTLGCSWAARFIEFVRTCRTAAG